MFKFRLQRVLEWKERREQDKATLLAGAKTGKDAAMEKCAALEGAREEGMQRASAMHAAGPTVGQLQNLRMIVDRLNVAIEQAHDEAETAETQVQRAQAEYTTAFQERRVLDRLREKNRESWMQAEAEADRKLMDAIALTGFVQRQASQAAPSPVPTRKDEA